jgi:hypothetical protein
MDVAIPESRTAKQKKQKINKNTRVEVQIYRGADKSLALPGRERLTGNLQPKRNYPTWDSNVS